MIEEFENAGVAAPIDDSPSAPPAEVMVMFSDVSVKADKTFVVTVAGNRCHVTQDYNKPLYQAIRAYLDEGEVFKICGRCCCRVRSACTCPALG